MCARMGGVCTCVCEDCRCIDVCEDGRCVDEDSRWVRKDWRLVDINCISFSP